MAKFWYWIPRIFSLIFILVISIFALDAFTDGYIWWQTILNFLVYLIPSFIVIGILLFAWGKLVFGGLLFICLALACIVLFFRKDILSYLILSGPLFLIGGIVFTRKEIS